MNLRNVNYSWCWNDRLQKYTCHVVNARIKIKLTIFLKRVLGPKIMSRVCNSLTKPPCVWSNFISIFILIFVLHLLYRFTHMDETRKSWNVVKLCIYSDLDIVLFLWLTLYISIHFYHIWGKKLTVFNQILEKD